MEWIITLALIVVATYTYRLHRDMKALKKEVRFNSNFRHGEGTGRYTLLCKKLREAGVRSRVIYFEDGTVHITGDQEAIEMICDRLNLVKYEHYFMNDFLPVREGVPIKHTHSVLGGF